MSQCETSVDTNSLIVIITFKQLLNNFAGKEVNKRKAKLLPQICSD